MRLNYKNALSAGLLGQRPKSKEPSAMPVLHFGVGGFHRSHQAWALQNLQNARREQYNDWGICGVCIMPGDIAFVKAFRAQDCLYFVQCFAADGDRKEILVTAIKELLHPLNEYSLILSRIVSKETKVISFTITEGGYNVDYDNHTFIWENPAAQSDLKRDVIPQTVFRILAEGLRGRMTAGAGKIVLMSCDNVQHNGDILRFALMEFLKKFDEELIPWVAANVSFVKTMVDRITPATSKEQKEIFSIDHGVEDECLVVCEDFFQWIIQDDPSIKGLPYAEMGAILVKDVAPYEKMKLRLLNGGHSLTGLLGDIMGYDRIHTSINDPVICAVYRRYCKEEVIDTLDDIEEVRYENYVDNLVRRFSNPMINDSTARIISGSTDKLPKFVLPVILDQMAGKKKEVKWGTLIIAAWYCYLDGAFKKDRMREVVDLGRDELLKLFDTADFSPVKFWDHMPILIPLQKFGHIKALFVDYVQALSYPDYVQRRLFIQQLLETEG